MPFTFDPRFNYQINLTPDKKPMPEERKQEPDDLELTVPMGIQAQLSVSAMVHMVSTLMLQREWFTIGPLDLKRMVSLLEQVIQRFKPLENAGTESAWMYWKLRALLHTCQQEYHKSKPKLYLSFQQNPIPRAEAEGAVVLTFKLVIRHEA